MGNFPSHHQGEARLISPHAPVARLPIWRRFVAWLCLLIAICLTVGAVALIATAPAPVSDARAVAAVGAQDATATPTSVPATPIAEEPSRLRTVDPARPLPTLSASQIALLLATPPESARAAIGESYDPFTIIPDRARMQMTTYTAKRGDTIDGIAYIYGLKRESIAWCNPPIIAQILRPGDVVTIPPADGACHKVLRTQGLSIRDIAAEYGLDDPYAVIDAPANGLADVSPETLLPSNFRLFIPGGEGKVVTWNAPVEQDGAGNVVAFDPGSPYSCGARSGGGTAWTNPLPNGTFVRGYYAGHSGIDIAAAVGTPIYAANGGPILYSGWNNWGYGRTVVIGHGPWSTLYGHMSSIIVGCGAYVYAGQVIGYVGSTGNSSGPHLHFEIRYQNEPQNPSATIGIGW